MADKLNMKTVEAVLWEHYEQPARDMLKIPTILAIGMDPKVVKKYNDHIQNMSKEDLLKTLESLPPVED